MATRKDSRGRILNKGEIQRANGTYAYIYTGPAGKRETIYAKTLSELRKKEDVIQKALIDGLKYGEAKTTTVNSMFDRYILTKRDLKITTLTNYFYVYNNYVRKEFGERMLASVKYSDVLLFYQCLARDKGLRSSTIESVDCVLHPAFEMAVRDEIIRINPSSGAIGAIKKTLGKDQIEKTPLTEVQQKAFLNFCRTNKAFSRWNTLFTVLLGTGCRIGEILGLRWDDVDFKNRTININHTLSYHMILDDGKTTCRFKITSPKTNAGNRVIPMMPSVYQALAQELEFCKTNGFCQVIVDGMTNFVFQNHNGNLHSNRTINRVIERIVRAYNKEESQKANEQKREAVLLPHFSCHILRHTFCSRFCENENNVKTIQTIMGHANIKTTMDVYAKVSNQVKIESLNALSSKLDIF